MFLSAGSEDVCLSSRAEWTHLDVPDEGVEIVLPTPSCQDIFTERALASLLQERVLGSDLEFGLLAGVSKLYSVRSVSG